MYVDNEAGQSITVLSQTNPVLITDTMLLGFKPGYAAWCATKDELWVTDANNGKVFFYKDENGALVSIGSTSTGADAHAIAFSDDGKFAWITNQGANTVSVIDVETHLVIKTIPLGNKPNGIVIR